MFQSSKNPKYPRHFIVHPVKISALQVASVIRGLLQRQCSLPLVISSFLQRRSSRPPLTCLILHRLHVEFFLTRSTLSWSFTLLFLASAFLSSVSWLLIPNVPSSTTSASPPGECCPRGPRAIFMCSDLMTLSILSLTSSSFFEDELGFLSSSSFLVFQSSFLFFHSLPLLPLPSSLSCEVCEPWVPQRERAEAARTGPKFDKMVLDFMKVKPQKRKIPRPYLV